MMELLNKENELLKQGKIEINNVLKKFSELTEKLYNLSGIENPLKTKDIFNAQEFKEIEKKVDGLSGEIIQLKEKLARQEYGQLQDLLGCNAVEIKELLGNMENLKGEIGQWSAITEKLEIIVAQAEAIIEQGGMVRTLEILRNPEKALNKMDGKGNFFINEQKELGDMAGQIYYLMKKISDVNLNNSIIKMNKRVYKQLGEELFGMSVLFMLAELKKEELINREKKILKGKAITGLIVLMGFAFPGTGEVCSLLAFSSLAQLDDKTMSLMYYFYPKSSRLAIKTAYGSLVGAQYLGMLSGLGLTGYFLVVAPLSFGSGLLADRLTAKTLKMMDVKPVTAEVIGMGVGIAITLGVRGWLKKVNVNQLRVPSGVKKAINFEKMGQGKILIDKAGNKISGVKNKVTKVVGKGINTTTNSIKNGLTKNIEKVKVKGSSLWKSLDNKTKGKLNKLFSQWKRKSIPGVDFANDEAIYAKATKLGNTKTNKIDKIADVDINKTKVDINKTKEINRQPIKAEKLNQAGTKDIKTDIYEKAESTTLEKGLKYTKKVLNLYKKDLERKGIIRKSRIEQYIDTLPKKVIYQSARTVPALIYPGLFFIYSPVQP